LIVELKTAAKSQARHQPSRISKEVSRSPSSSDRSRTAGNPFCSHALWAVPNNWGRSGKD